MTLKEIAKLVVTEDSARESALEVALAYLATEGDRPERAARPKSSPLPSRRRRRSSVPAADEAPESAPPPSLAAHDRRFHPQGYDPKRGVCKFREAMKRGDSADDLAAAETAEHKEKYGSLSAKKRDEYFRQMAKKHPEIDAEAALSEIGKIDDRKVQADAFAWLMRGAVRLPEDLYKVEQARELAGKARKDPLSFATPQACINALTESGHRLSEKPISVEELKKNPLMSGYQKHPYGVESFVVEDSREGQELMRRVIDTHWGRDANPWCLLARDENGGMGKAWDYWKHYSALPKRVAFRNGKLISFMATHGMDEEDAFDDAAHSGSEKLAKMYPGEYEEFEDWSDTDEGMEEDANFYQWLQVNYPDLAEAEGLASHAQEEWWDRNDEPHDGIPVGNMPAEDDPYGRWADYEIIDGKAVPGRSSSYSIEDGTVVHEIDWHKGERGIDGYRAWYDDGQLKEMQEDGKITKWYPYGSPSRIEEDGLAVDLYQNGKIWKVSNVCGDEAVKMPMYVGVDSDGKVFSMTADWIGEDGRPRHAGFFTLRDGAVRREGWRRGKPERDGAASSYEPEDQPIPLEKLMAMAQNLYDKAKRRYTPAVIAARSAPKPVQKATPARDASPFSPQAFLTYLAGGKKR